MPDNTDSSQSSPPPPASTGVPWRLIVYGLLLAGAAVGALHRLGSLHELLATLLRARLGFLLLAIVIQLVSLCNQAALYAALYRLVGIPIGWRDLAIVVWAGHFVNVAAPAAGLGSTALLVADGRRRGLDTAKVSLASTLYLLFNFGWFALLLLFGLGALWHWHRLLPAEIAAAGVIFGGLGIAIAALIVLSLAPRGFARLIGALARGVNRVSAPITKRELWPAAAAAAFAGEFAAAAFALRESGKKHRKGALAAAVFHTFWVDVSLILILGVCFLAFPGAGSVSAAALVTGYAIGTLFLVVSVTPQGLGVVEGVMTAIFVSFGVPLGRAALVVLAYRGLSFWLPLLVGLIASHSAVVAPSRTAGPVLKTQ